jgi:CRP/FNR family transcriptional regulator, cyclic AMP receptor protein
MESALDLLAAHPFLAGLPDRHLLRLAAWTKKAPFHEGYELFREGARADRFWLVRDGVVQLSTRIPGQGKVIVETLGAGSPLGWSWLFPPYRWHFSALAVRPTFTLEIDGAGVRRICDQEPELGYELTRRFMAVVVERLQATRMRLIHDPALAGGESA